MEDMVVHGTTANNMPEFPEVRTVIETLKTLSIYDEIIKVDVLRDKNIEGDPNSFKKSLEGNHFKDITQKGKFLIFHLDNNLVMISHLRMEGKYFLRDENEPINKHDIVLFHFKNNKYLAYNDTRKFGTLKISTEDKHLIEPPLNNVGPNPFEMDDASRLVNAFKNKSTAIKTSLLDQSIMSGLGNIYVDEVLFLSKINPETPAKLISKNELEIVLKNAKEVLTKAIKAGGSTIKSYHPQAGVDGNFQVELQVYGKKGSKCPRCGTEFNKIFVNGRGTTYCPHCQRNKAWPRVIVVTGKVGSGKSYVGRYLGKRKNYHLIDTDDMVHDLYKKKVIQDNLKKIIPELKIVNNDVDRSFLKDYLINNPKKKDRLEKYLYQVIYDSIRKTISKTSSKDVIVLEVPMLFKSHIDNLADEIYLVEVSDKTQLERLTKRNKDPESYININKDFYKQLDMKKVTNIISNDSSVTSLEKEIDSLIKL